MGEEEIGEEMNLYTFLLCHLLVWESMEKQNVFLLKERWRRVRQVARLGDEGGR